MTSVPTIHIVVAMTEDRLIGAAGKLPWTLPQDLALFRKLTLGNTVLMGRKTYESIGQPLEGRHNIIISSGLQKTTGIEIFATLEAGLSYAKTLNRDIFCIGGRSLYRAVLPLADQLHISWVTGHFHGDTYFPDIDLSQWQETMKTKYAGFTLISYHRKQ